VLGFRHGFDYDHIAAISDITSVQEKASTGMRLGLLYALGHASMIALLGGTVILFQLSFSPRLDSCAERLLGLTLIVLAIYVLGSLVWGNPKGDPTLARGPHHSRPPQAAPEIDFNASGRRRGLRSR
jgi:high-affinity nickel-transport protein